MSDVHDRVADLIEKRCDVPSASIAADRTFRTLNIDSLTLVELTLDVQDEFGVQVDLDEVEPEQTVGELVDLIKARAVAL